MKWIDDMFETLDKARDVESAHRRVGGKGTVEKKPARQRIPGASGRMEGAGYGTVSPGIKRPHFARFCSWVFPFLSAGTR